MGRSATDADRSYWLGRTEHYRQVLDAARAWLYSGGGSNDLAETVTRALQAKKGSAPSDAEIKTALGEKIERRRIRPVNILEDEHCRHGALQLMQ